ncbi:MAG: hypothetical protein AMXMBFR84_32730 [Candidatus Hydrogenedentota bacterium]
MNCLLVPALLLAANSILSADPIVSASPQKWLPVTLDFEGPAAEASGSNPNPFLGYRLQVLFTAPSGAQCTVPGYFDGDGNGGYTGSVWRVVFAPFETGEWRFKVSFRKGEAVAVDLDPNAGDPAAFDGAEGTFTVAPQDSSASGFYASGRLEYVGGHYLKFRDGDYYLKGGTDSPENLLAYAGFSNTRGRHTYEAHIADWREGDPDWRDGAGKGIIGALNYLASEHVNSIYFLPMNIGGDGKDVWPYLGDIDGAGNDANDNLHFDLAKLREWGIVFGHAQRKGLMLHFVLNEAEEANKRELDEGELGVERKLYYRELVARFGHFPALQWNLCEEYNLHFKLDPDMVKAWADYLHAVDPYDHPVTVHHASTVEKAWTPFLADKRFAVTSFQTEDIGVVARWRAQSREGGFPQVIGMDEFFPDKAHADNAERHRREYTWPIYLSGGTLEYILDALLKTENFRHYERHWRDMANARAFLEALPFWEMEPMPELLAGESEYTGTNNTVTGQVFAKHGEVYALYLPDTAQTGTLGFSGVEGEFTQRWYNPRTGEFAGETSSIIGGGSVALGAPPGDAGEDWAVLITRR